MNILVEAIDSYPVWLGLAQWEPLLVLDSSWRTQRLSLSRPMHFYPIWETVYFCKQASYGIDYFQGDCPTEADTGW